MVAGNNFLCQNIFIFVKEGEKVQMFNGSVLGVCIIGCFLVYRIYVKMWVLVRAFGLFPKNVFMSKPKSCNVFQKSIYLKIKHEKIYYFNIEQIKWWLITASCFIYKLQVFPYSQYIYPFCCFFVLFSLFFEGFSL